MLEFGDIAGLSASYSCLSNSVDRKKSDHNLNVQNNQKKSFDSEHDDAMPNHISVETHNNEHQHITMQCQTTLALKQITMSINTTNVNMV